MKSNLCKIWRNINYDEQNISNIKTQFFQINKIPEIYELITFI